MAPGSKVGARFCTACSLLSEMIETEYQIVPPKAGIHFDWREFWRYRDLFVVLSWRDLAVRYKQSVVGIGWALFQPMITMLIFTFIFNRVAKISSGDQTPYPIFVYVGLLYWQFYSGTLLKASEAMVAGAPLIQKVYFPRLIIPASTALTGIVDMGFASIVLAGLMLYFGYWPHLLGIAIAPLLVLCCLLNSLGQGLFCSAMNIKYRDVRYALPFFVQILMYVTPVIYPVQMLDRQPILKGLMIWLNPMTGIISCARASFLGNSQIDFSLLGISFLVSAIYLVLGLLYFGRTERYFADIV
jgi:lipopolysaccharide transport system permease protein